MHYQIPRIRGTYPLHQLRLVLGNEAFSGRWTPRSLRTRNRDVTTAQLVAALSGAAGRDVAPLLAPWIEAKGFPDPKVEAKATKEGDAWTVSLVVTQAGTPYHFLGSVAIDAGGKRLVRPYEVKGERTELAFSVPQKPEEGRF